MSDVAQVLAALDKLDSKMESVRAEMHALALGMEGSTVRISQTEDRLAGMKAALRTVDPRLTKLETERSTLWAVLMSLPVIGVVAGWFIGRAA